MANNELDNAWRGRTRQQTSGAALPQLQPRTGQASAATPWGTPANAPAPATSAAPITPGSVASNVSHPIVSAASRPVTRNTPRPLTPDAPSIVRSDSPASTLAAPATPVKLPKVSERNRITACTAFLDECLGLIEVLEGRYNEIACSRTHADAVLVYASKCLQLHPLGQGTPVKGLKSYQFLTYHALLGYKKGTNPPIPIYAGVILHSNTEIRIYLHTLERGVFEKSTLQGVELLPLFNFVVDCSTDQSLAGRLFHLRAVMRPLFAAAFRLNLCGDDMWPAGIIGDPEAFLGEKSILRHARRLLAVGKVCEFCHKKWHIAFFFDNVSYSTKAFIHEFRGCSTCRRTKLAARRSQHGSDTQAALDQLYEWAKNGDGKLHRLLDAMEKDTANPVQKAYFEWRLARAEELLERQNGRAARRAARQHAVGTSREDFAIRQWRGVPEHGPP